MQQRDKSINKSVRAWAEKGREKNSAIRRGHGVPLEGDTRHTAGKWRNFATANMTSLRKSVGWRPWPTHIRRSVRKSTLALNVWLGEIRHSVCMCGVLAVSLPSFAEIDCEYQHIHTFVWTSTDSSLGSLTVNGRPTASMRCPLNPARTPSAPSVISDYLVSKPVDSPDFPSMMKAISGLFARVCKRVCVY